MPVPLRVRVLAPSEVVKVSTGVWAVSVPRKSPLEVDVVPRARPPVPLLVTVVSAVSVILPAQRLLPVATPTRAPPLAIPVPARVRVPLPGVAPASSWRTPPEVTVVPAVLVVPRAAVEVSLRVLPLLTVTAPAKVVLVPERVRVPVPAWMRSPLPLRVLATVRASERLKDSVPLFTIALPAAIEPVVPPLPRARVPVWIVVVPV